MFYNLYEYAQHKYNTTQTKHFVPNFAGSCEIYFSDSLDCLQSLDCLYVKIIENTVYVQYWLEYIEIWMKAKRNFKEFLIFFNQRVDGFSKVTADVEKQSTLLGT